MRTMASELDVKPRSQVQAAKRQQRKRMLGFVLSQLSLVAPDPPQVSQESRADDHLTDLDLATHR
jgi:hypothetical protein